MVVFLAPGGNSFPYFINIIDDIIECLIYFDVFVVRYVYLRVYRCKSWLPDSKRGSMGQARLL